MRPAGIVELSLSGCSVLEDANVVSAISKLPRLTSLDLSACRKLSPQFVKEALAASHTAALQLADGERLLEYLIRGLGILIYTP